MNLRTPLRLCLAMLASLPLTASAQSVAPRSPPDLKKLLADAPRPDAPTKVVPFLGTATKEATPQQRQAAHLPDGVGLAVQYVLADSPAEKAGIQPGDVLHRLGDQILINDPQFRVLLRTFAPGTVLHLTVIRDGRPRDLKVVLGRRRVPVDPTPARELLRWMLMPPDASSAEVDPLEFTARYEDDRHVLALTSDRNGKRLEVRDKQGKLVFDGPVNTAAQRQLVPAELRPKLKALETPPKAPTDAHDPREEEKLP